MSKSCRAAYLILLVIALSAGGAAGFRSVAADQGGEDLESLQKELKKSVRWNDLPGITAVVRKMGEIGTREAMESLLTVSIAVPESEVYEAIAEGLTTVRSEEALEFLFDVLRREKKLGKKFDHWRHRVTVAKAFGGRDDEATIQPLVDALTDKTFPVRRQVLQSLGKRGDRRAVPPILDILEKEEEAPGVPWEDALQCLRDITGQDLKAVADWRNWWEAHGKKGSETTKKPADPSDEEATQDVSTNFFGVKIISKRILFVIDVSGSMALWDPGGDGEQPKGSSKGKGETFPRSRQRIQRAKRELTKAIRELRPQVKFNIITFSHQLARFKKGKLISATKGNKGKAIQWIQRLRAKGGTATDEALVEALQIPEANTIVLLADGVVDKPGGDNPTVSMILEQVKQLNRFRKMKIYTFGFDGEGKPPPGMQVSRRLTPEILEEFRQMMISLAAEHEGTYTSIK
ncbi:MAG: HEAT repeat domain-containing protein [Planctomycetota bacterium]|nr:HEAT repeat domain-containing protein [Planctomycetota bacterium]